MYNIMKHKTSSIPIKSSGMSHYSCHTTATQFMCEHVRVVCVCVHGGNGVCVCVTASYDVL